MTTMQQSQPVRQQPRKRKCRRRRPFRTFLILLGLAAGLFLLPRVLNRGDSGESAGVMDGPAPDSGSYAQTSPSGDEVLQKLEAAARDNADIRDILHHREDYPDSLLELLSKNEEAIQFVLDYPDHKDDTPPDTIGDVTWGEIPLLLQWDERWGYTTYGTDFLAVTGCGPTCLAMVAAGLNGDASITPSRVAEFAQNNGYYVDGAGSAWSLMTEGCLHYGLWSQELPLDENRMRSELEAGNPIICSMLPGDFTEKGHFIVLVGVEDDLFRVNDPNSQVRSDQLWSYERLSTQIGNLWAFYTN